jgi:tetratricopeptide (TPR) repeat protein
MRRKTGFHPSIVHLLITGFVLMGLFISYPVSADTSAEVAASYIRRGDDLMAQKMYHEALDQYQIAVENDPYNSMAWNKLGIAHMRTGRYQDAVDSFEKAIAIDPYYSEAWTNLGDSLAMLGRHNEAIGAYNRALGINQNDLYALLKKGISLQETGDSPGAMKIYEEVVSISDQEVRRHPNYAVYDAELWTNKGEALFHLGRYEEAVTAYETALKINPKLERANLGKRNAMDEILLARGNPTPVVTVTEGTGLNPLPKIVPMSSISSIGALMGAAFLVAIRLMLKKS